VRRASSPGVERAFCTGCGTQLLMDYAGSDTVDVAVGTLDEPSGVSARDNIFVCRAAAAGQGVRCHAPSHAGFAPHWEC